MEEVYIAVLFIQIVTEEMPVNWFLRHLFKVKGRRKEVSREEKFLVRTAGKVSNLPDFETLKTVVIILCENSWPCYGKEIHIWERRKISEVFFYIATNCCFGCPCEKSEWFDFQMPSFEACGWKVVSSLEDFLKEQE